MPPQPHRLIRPHVRRLHGYVPGEQPRVKGLVKLNTNENPYPPSPKVLQAIRDGADERLRLYPDPAAAALREKLAKWHGCASENIVVGNGSDDLLALATRAFVEPQGGGSDEKEGAGKSGATVQYFDPSYSLYSVLADIHRARKNPVPLEAPFELPSPDALRQSGHWDFQAALTFITTPNAPTGAGYRTADLERLCRAQKGVVILDEAYADFAPETALALALKHPHVMVSRTFSKAYSLCFQRIGYFVGHPELIGALNKIRDSYNVNGLGQIGALATLSNLAYYRKNFRRILRSRERLSEALSERGFGVFPSAANFILVEPPDDSAREWMERLRSKKILVRFFDRPPVDRYLRITIGAEEDIEKLIRAVDRIRRTGKH